MADSSNFLFLGGRLCLDFVNTEIVVRGGRHDLLSDFRRWMAWQTAARLRAEVDTEALVRKWRGTAFRAEALRQAIAFRSELRKMAGRIASHRPVPESSLRAINELLRRGAAYAPLTRAGRGFVRKVRRNLDRPIDLLVPVAEDAATLLCEGDPERVRRCGNPGCILFFYDTSRNRTRRWCSMDLCGNRAKVAAHYRRRRRRQPADPA